jgi:hypothetical protein
MLSICVPIFNFRVDALIDEIIRQIEQNSLDAEIICIDDASITEFKISNRNVFEGKNINYIELEKNIGRAAIRNLFLSYSNADYLLFLDCDSHINRPDFLLKYIEKLKISKTKVVYGGRIYANSKPKRQYRLRWKYGHYRESKSLIDRKADPYLSFQTNNFIIERALFERVKFNEEIKTYGHEDTLFALDLERLSIEIEHIDNSVLNGHLETNAEFMDKTKAAIENLVFLKSQLPDSIYNSILLVRYYLKFSIFLKFIIKYFSFLILILEHLLKANYFNAIRFFSLYKLLYFSKCNFIKK